MMPLNRDEEVSRLRNEMRRIAIIEAPGAIVFGLALYGKFNVSGPTLHPLLDDPTVTTGMLVVGGIIIVWGTLRAISVSKRIAEIGRGSGS